MHGFGALRPLARRAATLAASTAVAALCLALPACGGGGHHHHDEFEGTLEVANEAFSVERLDSIDLDEVGGPDHLSFDVFLDPGESFLVDLFPDTWDVTLFWADGFVEFHTVDVFDGSL